MKYIIVLFAVSLTACFPDISELGLADCMKVCNSTTKSCLDRSEVKFNKCPNDPVCQHVLITESKNCLTSGMSCMTSCVAAAEKKLSE